MLAAKDVDLAACTAKVHGKTGPRMISLTARAAGILAEAGEKFPEGPVLRNSQGKPWSDRAIQCQFRRASMRANVHLVAYHLRHDFWTRAHAAGVSDLVIAAQLGHADLTQLQRHYATVTPEMTRDAVERAKS